MPSFSYVEFAYHGDTTNVEVVMALTDENGEVVDFTWKPLAHNDQAVIEQAKGAAWTMPLFTKYLPYVDVAVSVRVVNIEYPVDENLVISAHTTGVKIPETSQEEIKARWARYTQELKNAG